MASLIVGAGLLIHDKIKSDKAKRREKKRKAYEARYNELEREHTTHEAAYLQRKATGDISVLSNSNDSQVSTGIPPRRMSSRDSMGSQGSPTDHDGPAKRVEDAMKRREPVRQ